MDNNTVAERLGHHFSTHKISIAQVSRDTSIQYDTLQQILQGRVKAMGVDKFAAIWRAYPDLDAWYILTGEQLNVQRAAALSSVEELQAFQEQMNATIEKRIRELSEVSGTD